MLASYSNNIPRGLLYPSDLQKVLWELHVTITRLTDRTI